MPNKRIIEFELARLEQDQADGLAIKDARSLWGIRVQCEDAEGSGLLGQRDDVTN